MQETDGAPWSERMGHSAVVHQDHLWLLGGFTFAGASNEVWTYIEAPSIISPPITVAHANVLYTYDVVVNSTSTTLQVSGLPGWLSFNGTTLSGTPQQGDMGLTGDITITATNSEGSYDQVFQIDVQGQPPQITSTPVTIVGSGAEYTYTVTATGFPAPALSASGLPAWLSFDAGTGVLSGTAGSVGFTGNIAITASNGVGADALQVFKIDVRPDFSKGDDGGDDGGGGCVSTSEGPIVPAILLLMLLATGLFRRRDSRLRSRLLPPSRRIQASGQ